MFCILTRGRVRELRTQKHPRPRAVLLRSDPLEAKDTGTNVLQNKKKGLQTNFSVELQKKKVFKNSFLVIYKILTIQKIVLSSGSGQGNFPGLEASRSRTSKCVLEDSTADTYPIHFNRCILPLPTSPADLLLTKLLIYQTVLSYLLAMHNEGYPLAYSASLSRCQTKNKNGLWKLFQFRAIEN